MNRIIFLLLTVCSCLAAVADTLNGDNILSGTITDKKSGEKLVGVTIYFPELSNGTTTDENGHYEFTRLPDKTTPIQVSYLGHKTIVKNIDLSTTHTLNLKMDESDAMINEVVVTGLTGQALMKDSPTPIAVVGKTMLAATPSTNIIDALSFQPGVSQVTTGGGISKPVVRGLGFNRVVVVNDGIRQEGNQWGEEHGVEIDPESVSSAEILKGPASLMYGSDAMGGAIIFHDEPTAPIGTMEANAETQYQTNNGLFGYSVNFKGNEDGIVWNARWSQTLAHAYKDKIDQYVVGSQYRERAAEGMAGINRSWGYTHLKLSYYNLTPGIAEGERSDSYTYGRQLPFQQVYHYKVVSDNSFFLGNGTLQAILAYQQNQRQEYEDSPTAPGLDMKLHTVNYDLKYRLPLTSDWNLATGINGMYQKMLNEGDEYLIPAYNLFDIGAYATSSYKVGALTLSGGVRFDNRHLHTFALENTFTQLSRNFSAFTGSVGAVYAVSPKMNIRLNLARGFRAPNLSELSSNGVHEGSVRYELGNGNLHPEYSWQMDAGWDYTSNLISFQLSLFANFIDNYIFADKLAGIKTEGYDTYQYRQGNARMLGGEASIDLHPIDRLHFQNTFSYVNSVQLHQPHESKYLPWTPAPRFTSDLRYDLIRDGKVLNNTYVALQAECDLHQNHFYALNGTETATPSYTLFNILAGTDLKIHGVKRASLYLGCTNLFNRAYQSHLSRLKYVEATPDNGHPGIYNMGRNITMKLVVPVEF